IEDQYLKSVIEGMGGHRDPQVAGPVIEVAEHNAQYHPGEESLKLKVDSAENDATDPDSRRGRAQHAHDVFLYNAPEYKLFSNAGKDGDDEQVDGKDQGIGHLQHEAQRDSRLCLQLI